MGKLLADSGIRETAMPSPATVEAFVATVEAEDYIGAIERFYAADA